MSTLPCDRFIRVFHAVESDSRRHVLASAPEFARLFHQTKHRLQGRYEIDRFPSRGRGLSPETRRQGRRPRRGRLAPFASGSSCLRRYACPLAGMPVPQETPFASSAEHTSDLQSLMHTSSAVFCLTQKTPTHRIP